MALELASGVAALLRKFRLATYAETSVFVPRLRLQLTARWALGTLSVDQAAIVLLRAEVDSDKCSGKSYSRLSMVELLVMGRYSRWKLVLPSLASQDRRAASGSLGRTGEFATNVVERESAPGGSSRCLNMVARLATSEHPRKLPIVRASVTKSLPANGALGKTTATVLLYVGME